VVSTLDTVISKHQADLRRVLDDLHLTVESLSGPNLANLNIDLAWLGPAADQLTKTRGNGRWLEGGVTGLGPLQPNLFGPQPNYSPPNYPYPGVPIGIGDTDGEVGN
jgi:phospholipid/cholesterol/gamma-HCH transport system substrate-binding protein